MIKTTTRGPVLLWVHEMTRLAVASANLAVGYAVTSRHARDAELVAECVALAARHRTIAAEVASTLASLGARTPRITPTCGERLRWEWLASSARLIDGAAEGRLLAECARIHREADDAAGALVNADTGVPVALRDVLTARERFYPSEACFAGNVSATTSASPGSMLNVPR